MPTDAAAAERARWLAELSDALEEAQWLLWNLVPAGSEIADALDLSARLEAAQAQVRSLRLGRNTEEFGISHPQSSNVMPWNLRVEDCDA